MLTHREAIKEDDDGLLEASVAEIIQRAKRKRQAQRRPNTRLGMMRHLYLIIDCSESMLDQDLKPTRQLCTAKVRDLVKTLFKFEFLNVCQQAIIYPIFGI